jgi:type IV pilus assembly protein PilM
VKGGVLLLHRTVDLGANAVVDGAETFAEPGELDLAAEGMEAAALGTAAVAASEVAQAVSVAAAYFEDTLESAPGAVLATGTLGAAALAELLAGAELGPVAVREMVEGAMLDAGAASESAGTRGGVPLGWLAGVRGALCN